MILHSAPSLWENRLLALASDPICRSGSLFHQDHERDEPEAVQKAFTTCQAITARHSRSFSLASGLLPKDKRMAMRALYAFCRTADNLVDDPQEPAAAGLAYLREGVDSSRRTPGDPVLTAWKEIRSRYQIPTCYAEQLLDGVACDMTPQRYRTFEELSVYCYGVASTVGLMSMHITGFQGAEAVPYAVKLGVALQLTNILRDVGEDAASGRLYLPLDELYAFDLAEADLAVQRVDERWRRFMRFQIARARELYAQALPGIAWLHPDGQLAVAAAATLYQGILADIEANDYDVFTRRAHLDGWQKVRALIEAYWFTRRLPKPQPGRVLPVSTERG